jgi:hypothetical protein
VSDEILFPSDIDVSELQQLFEDAYMDASIDEDGDLTIEDEYRCFLRPDLDGRMLAAGAIFGARSSADERARLRFVNRVNDGLMMIRASLTSDGRFYFDYYIPVEGGITKKAVVVAVRRFLSYLAAAMDQDIEDVVVAQGAEDEEAEGAGEEVPEGEAEGSEVDISPAPAAPPPQRPPWAL